MRDALWTDLRLATRTLRRSPAFTIGAGAILALGIGISAGVFTAVDALLLRPLPYGDPSRIVSVAPIAPGISVSKATLERVRERQRSFESLAGYSRWGFMVRSADGANFVQGAVGTADLFNVLGVRAAIGRTFEEGDDLPGREPVVVLSDAYWRRQYGGSRAIIGASVTLNGRSHTIVGVMPPGFEYPAAGMELWTPTVLDPADRFDYASAGYLLFVGRLRPNASLSAANLDLRAVLRAARAAFPDAYSADFGDGATVVPLQDSILGSTRIVLLLSLAAVALIVLVTCANVGNLVLARTSGRLRDIAVRTALGARRRDLARMVLVEVLVLGLLGGALGIVVAAATTRGIATLLPPDMLGVGRIGLDGRSVLFVTLLSVIVALLCGFVPTLRVTRDESLGDRLVLVSGRVTGGAAERRAMGALLVVESATALLLAMGAALMVQSVWRLAHEDVGFASDRVTAFDVVLPQSVTTPERQAAFYDALHGALARLPGVVSVGAGSPLPFSGSNQTPSLSIDGVAPRVGEDPIVDWRRVSPGYFATLAIALRRGRLFTAADRAGGVRVALINETFARRYLPDRDPIGQRIRTVLDGSEWATIVGVVRDTKVTSLGSAAPPQMYRPLAQRPASFSSFVVRTGNDGAAVVRTIPTVVHSVDRDAVSLSARPVRAMLGASFTQRTTLATVLSAFAVLALVLGGCGVSALAGYRVSERRREIAVRLALGATPAGVTRLVIRETMLLTLLGVLIGTGAAFASTGVLRSQLHGVGQFDPLTLVGVATLLVCSALVASWAPARVAATIDPARALQQT